MRRSIGAFSLIVVRLDDKKLETSIMELAGSFAQEERSDWNDSDILVLGAFGD